MLILTWFLVLIINFGNANESFKHFLENCQVSQANNYETIAVLIVGKNSNEEIASDYLQKHQNENAAFVVATFELDGNMHFAQFNTKNYVIFGRSEQIADTLHMWLPNVDIYGKFQFVSDQELNLNHFFALMWNAHILNYILVYPKTQRVQIIAYDNFTQKMLNYTQKECQFKDRITNLQGFNFNIMMMNDPPRNWFDKGVFRGEDLENLNLITSALNATYTLNITDDYKNINNAIRKGSIDLTFARRFALSADNELVSPLKPALLEYIVCAVPNSDRMQQYKQIFTIFSPLLWTSLVIFLIINIYLIQLFQKVFLGHVDIADSAMMGLAMFLSASYIRPKMAQTSIRILLVCWAFFSILINFSFSSQLGSNLVAVRYSPGIATIEELGKTRLKLGLIDGFQKFIFTNVPEVEHLQLVPFPNIYELGRSMIHRQEKMAYIGLKTILEKIAQSKGSDGRHKFLLLDTTIIPGFNVYDAPANSIWARKIEEMLQRNFEADLTSRGFKPIPAMSPDDSDPVRITLFHLLGAYIIWLVGLVLSSIAFFVEKCFWKKN